MILTLWVKFINKLVKPKIYNTYSEALQACSFSGYDDEEIAKTVYEKTRLHSDDVLFHEHLKKHHAAAYDNLIALIKELNNDVVNILDFGGACGAYYFALRKCLNHRYKLNWFIIEKKAMCKYGKRLENGELKFFEQLEVAKTRMPSIDIFNVSGVLQYVSEPYGLVNSILASNPKYILFSRMCFTLGNRDIVAIQKSMLSWHGVGKLPKDFKDKEIECPITIIQKNKFDEVVRKKYEYQIIFEDNSGLMRVNREQLVNCGVVCRLKYP